MLKGTAAAFAKAAAFAATICRRVMDMIPLLERGAKRGLRLNSFPG
jgi:hypothetical protein